MRAVLLAVGCVVLGCGEPPPRPVRPSADAGREVAREDWGPCFEETTPLGPVRPYVGHRVLPHYVDGVPIGVKVVGVRPGSPMAARGLVSGDFLVSVDGLAVMGDADGSLRERLLSDERISLVVERRGKRLVLPPGPTEAP